jgi:hypothetical protein
LREIKQRKTLKTYRQKDIIEILKVIKRRQREINKEKKETEN